MQATEPKILPRDKLLRDTFTPAEAQLCALILLTTAVAFWLADPRSFWALGFFMIVGGFCPFILKTHEISHPFFIDLLWPKFWLLSAPIWWLILQFIVGLLQNPIETITVGKETFVTLEPVNKWLPISAVTKTTWINVLGYGSMYLCALNLFLVPKSRAFFEKVLPWLCLSATLVAIFGYLQKAMNLQAPMLTKGTGLTDFFAFFPYDGHWAAFAILWCCVCTSMALLATRYDDSPDFIYSTGPWYLTGAGLLGASGYIVKAHWPATILLITFSGCLLLIAMHFLADNKDKHRKTLALTCGLLASIVFASGIFRAFQGNPHGTIQSQLHQAAIHLFKDSPLFGWGMDSYRQLAPFYLDDTLLNARYDRAGSDALQLLAEAGIVGLLLPLLILSSLLYRYFKGKVEVRLSNHLLIGCLAIAVLACLDTPLMSPAVFLSFFTILFTALRWAELSRNKVDEVDAIERPALVTPETERSVPFFTEEYQEKEK